MTAALALNATNLPFVTGLYEQFLQNPQGIDISWQAFFGDLNDDHRALLSERTGASWTPKQKPLPNEIELPVKKSKTGKPAAADTAGSAIDEKALQQSLMDSLRAANLVKAYRTNGHFSAKLDPLGLQEPGLRTDLDPAYHGFTAVDMGRRVFVDGIFGQSHMTVGALLQRLKDTYAGTMGVEFSHIQDVTQRTWLLDRLEGGTNQQPLSAAEKTQVLKDLTAAEGLEKFLGKKFVGTKRFGLDGSESTIPALAEILRRGAQLGIADVVIGMAHRGRLNVLTNILQKPFKALFSEFLGTPANPEDTGGSGDVKYHMGYSSDRTIEGQKMHLSLTANPSHLEAVNPVVQGKARAKQTMRHDELREQVLSILIHGDAAIAGQGMVAECLMMSELKGYRVGGTVHVVINNQIGFTTSPGYSRSSPYPTDITKMVMPPIFHVNGDDPEAVVRAARLAIEFRQEFHKDTVLDIFGYRRFGHNESDEPAFTQPKMYSVIRDLPSTRTKYAAQLVANHSLDQAATDKIETDFYAYLETEFAAAQSYKPNKADWLEGAWAGLKPAPADDAHRGDTATKGEQLDRLAKAITTAPDNFKLNSKIARQLQAKAEMFKTGQGFDWATAEALAFGTLLDEGTPVRLSGQDSGRGTFSQRHAVFTDQDTEAHYIPLNNIREGQGTFEVIDSPLSEAAVLGFEYGYTLADPRALVMWEGQFGDFVNGAQVIIDQFIASAESKWLRMSGITMLLPHGYEGQGPEHSSARLERFLQLCAEDNMQVVNCTTPANYFHVLRRQVRRDFRKPLIIMTPKSLLRHKLCVSPLSMMTDHETFHRVLHEDVEPKNPAAVKRVVLCSGKIYYDLLEERNARGAADVTIMRLEQLYPFPTLALAQELKKYPQAEVIWCQEEPANMGAWTFVDRRIEAVLSMLGMTPDRPRYVGRPEAASPAVGLHKRHETEQARLVDEALTVNAAARSKPLKAVKRA